MRRGCGFCFYICRRGMGLYMRVRRGGILFADAAVQAQTGGRGAQERPSPLRGRLYHRQGDKGQGRRGLIAPLRTPFERPFACA